MKLNKLLIFLGFLLLTRFAQAGGSIQSGGGKGILCGSTLATLDLFEARQRGLGILPGSGDFEADIGSFGAETYKHIADSNAGFDSPQLAEMLRKEMHDSIISHFRSIPKGQRLPLTGDATLPPLPDNCSAVQIAIYAENGSIYLDADYWSMLPPIERVALVVHEWIYYRARQYGGALNSDESRRVLGLIFSGKNPEPLLSPIWNADHIAWCMAGTKGTDRENYEFYAIDETQGNRSGVGIYFKEFKSSYLTSRVSVFLPGMTLEKLVSNRFSNTFGTATNHLFGKEWVFEMAPGYDSTTNIELRAYVIGENPPPLSLGFCQLKW